VDAPAIIDESIAGLPPPIADPTTTETTTAAPDSGGEWLHLSQEPADLGPIEEEENPYGGEPEPKPVQEAERGGKRKAPKRGPDGRVIYRTRDAPKQAGPAKPAPPPTTEDVTGNVIQDTKQLDPNAALDGPVATASAVSVHVPAVGEAVLYQHMLLPEGKALTVHLEARRHKASKQRKSK
jgi:hypothetical protein